MAHQLLGREGYDLVAAADKAGVSPGSDALRELFTRATPCLILIDEWIAFVRQLYGISGLPAGSFDANITFAQALTEAAKAVPGTLIVASLPSSDIEVGGDGGREALSRLRNTFGRLESAWRPASAEEGFEIVRRRLFQNITDYKARDAVARAYVEMYRANPQDFPNESRESGYERRLQAAYPIHPELFDRLYNDWSSLDKFQRTRGVLRLMACVISALWDSDDKNLLIMPAMVPIDTSSVQNEIMHYLDDPWRPVIERDVDGQTSLPIQIDKENPNLGRYNACRRVARTVYLGSAPTSDTSHKGLDDSQIRLGCVQPGESIPIFGDALRRLTDHATHLYVDGRRYWYSTQPSVTRVAQERAQQYKDHDVRDEIKSRVREDVRDSRSRGDFAAVYVAQAAAEIPDERESRLVILGPEYPHSRGTADSKARQQAAIVLEQRGSGSRLYRNTLVFLAADGARLAELEQAVRQLMAWKSIESERETLNLDAFQSKQARTKRETSEDAVRQRIPETYHWLIAPEQPDPMGSIEWQELKVLGTEGLAVRAAKKLRAEDLLVNQLAGHPLRREMDKIPLWPAGLDQIPIRQLMDYYAQYPYLTRVRDSKVIAEAIEDGVALTTWAQDSFAYADDWDETANRYRGLRVGQRVSVNTNGSGFIIRPDAALRQIADDQALVASTTTTVSYPSILAGQGSGTVKEGANVTTGAVQPSTLPVVTKARRFHGAIQLDPTRMSRDASTINMEVLQHLTSLMGANARITLEIEIDVPDGVPDNVVRTVMENCRTLKFSSQEFEDE
jgi:hypothetical protein